MGWLFTHRPAGISDRDWFQKECVGDYGEILACATVRMVFYAAVRVKDSGEVYGLVCLTQRRPNREYYNYGWKSMSDDMGPCEDYAPAKVLDLLTPTDREYANDWRARCRANLELQAQARKVKPGSVVEFAHPIQFTNGAKLTRFTYVQRSTLRGEDGLSYRIPDWRRRQFAIAQPA